MGWFTSGDRLTAKALNSLYEMLATHRVAPHRARLVSFTTGMPQFETALSPTGVYVGAGRVIYTTKEFGLLGNAYARNIYNVKTFESTFIAANDPYDGDFYVYVTLTTETVDTGYLMRQLSGDITSSDDYDGYAYVDCIYTPDGLRAGGAQPDSNAAIIAHYSNGTLRYHVRGALFLFPNAVPREDTESDTETE